MITVTQLSILVSLIIGLDGAYNPAELSVMLNDLGALERSSVALAPFRRTERRPPGHALRSNQRQWEVESTVWRLRAL